MVMPAAALLIGFSWGGNGGGIVYFIVYTATNYYSGFGGCMKE